MQSNLFLYALLGDVFVIGMGIVGFAWYFSRRSVFKKESEILDSANEKALDILQKANNEALSVVEEARAKVRTLETKISFDEEAFQQLLKTQQDSIIKAVSDHLQKITTSVLSNYQETLRKTTEADLSVFRTSTVDLEKTARDEVESFKNLLEKETIGTQRDVAQKIREAYTAAQDEIKTYRAERLTEIDDHIGEIILAVSQRVIGKALSLENHRDLVISSLERAKKEGFFEK